VALSRAVRERGTRTEADSSAALRNDKQQGLRNDRQQWLRDDKQRTAISFLAMDVSFISATLVLPAVLRALVPAGAAWRGEVVVLIKPQFEAGREHVGKGGIVREQAGRDIAIERVKQCVVEQGGTGIEVIDSPIHGMEGNWEYLLHARFGGATAA
jgi:predicted rRNA methylase YqxC with S4 and FtsJ domains